MWEEKMGAITTTEYSLRGALLLFTATTECILTDSLLPLLLDDGVLSTIQ